MSTHFILVYAPRSTGRAFVPRGRLRPQSHRGERPADVGEGDTEVAPQSAVSLRLVAFV